MRKGKTILFCGDSITAGLGLTTTLQYATAPAKIAKLITDNYGQIRLINKAISGWKTADFITVPYYWSRIEAELFILHIGTNDLSNGTTPDTFQSNLNKIIDLYKRINPHGEVIICTQTRRTDSPYNGTALDPFRATVTTVAAAKGAFLCRLENGWTDAENAAHLQADGLHPNDAGQVKIANMLWPVVQQTNFIKSMT